MTSSKGISKTSIRLTLTAVSTALVCVATMVFSIYVPQTRGFFNLGETMVYAVALLLGPLIGSFAGGVGSMFADILLGYYHYAPATLIIKALEGGVVGFLGKKRQTSAKYTANEWRVFNTEIAILIGMLISVVGFFYYSGFVELYSSFISYEVPTSTLFIPPEFWIGIGVLVIIVITTVSFISEAESGIMIISAFFGGLLMVAGYFLYEQFFLGVFALAEVPINIGQMTIGIIVAIPIVKVVRRTVPQIMR